MPSSWLSDLKSLVTKKPIVLLRFRDDVWTHIGESRSGPTEFTVARPHDLFDRLKTPTACLVLGIEDGREELLFGVASSHKAVTTLETRIKVKRAIRIAPGTQAELVSLLKENRHKRTMKDRLECDSDVIVLTPGLSCYLVQRLASIQSNRSALRRVSAEFAKPRTFQGVSAMQEDALSSALKAFGVPADSPALSVDLVPGKKTALERISILEDSAIEHDARSVPGYDLFKSDLTGRAVFRNRQNNEELEVFTANRRPLEHCFGVDLIYFNTAKRNVVMLQYKMLNPDKGGDWVYRPDKQLEIEMNRMRTFSKANPPQAPDYRLNPAACYFKFVKRNALLGSGSVIISLDHFDIIRTDPAFRGKKKALRVGYEALSGRYLRQAAFLDLVSSGYIGTYAETTEHLGVLIQEVLAGNKAVIAAFRRPLDIATDEETDSDDLLDFDPEFDYDIER